MLKIFTARVIFFCLSFVEYLHLSSFPFPRFTSGDLVTFATRFFTDKPTSNVYFTLLLLFFRSCFNVQVPGRPVACVLQGDKREEPLSRHEVVSAVLWDVQGLLCAKNATKELTSVRLAGSQLFAVLLFINTHTHVHTPTLLQTKYHQITYNLIKLIYFCLPDILNCFG